jgi:alkylated DNA repair dioxygenase AlkB
MKRGSSKVLHLSSLWLFPVRQRRAGWISDCRGRAIQVALPFVCWAIWSSHSAIHPGQRARRQRRSLTCCLSPRRVLRHPLRLTRQRLEQADPIPSWLTPLATRVEAFAALAGGSIAHALVTEYETGAGIGLHRDKKQFDLVFGVSLGSSCNFRFRRKTASKWERFTLNVEPRSLYLISGDARNIWEHSIAPVESPRYSITFRTMAGP